MGKHSQYLSAGSPICCAVPSCRRSLERYCIRGDDDRYYCSEVCAQVGLKIDFAKVNR